MRLLTASLSPDLYRPAVAIGLVGVYAMFIALAGQMDGALALAVPLGLVALMWATPLGVTVLNGERAPMVFFVCCLIAFMDGSFRARGWADQSIDWQVLAKLGVWVAAGGIALVNIPRILPYFRHPHIMFAGALVILIPVSSLWAVDPIYALSSGMFHVFIFGFALVLASQLGERWAVMAVMIGMACLVIPSLAISPFTTSLGGISEGSTGELDRIRGLTGHPVALASLASKFVICLVYIIERRWISRPLGYGLLAAAVVTIIITQSRMPALSMIAATTLTFLIRRQLFGIATPFVALPLVLLTLAMLALGVDEIISEDVLRMISRSGRPEEILTLSGRSEIWAFVMLHVADAPILGHGQGAGPAILLTGFKDWSLVHAHSLYFQALLCLGIVGLFVLVGALLLQMQLAVIHQRTFPLYVVIYLTVYGITETSFFNNLPDGNFLFWSLAVALTLPSGKDSQAQEAEDGSPAAKSAQSG